MVRDNLNKVNHHRVQKHNHCFSFSPPPPPPPPPPLKVNWDNKNYYDYGMNLLDESQFEDLI